MTHEERQFVDQAALAALQGMPESNRTRAATLEEAQDKAARIAFSMALAMLRERRRVFDIGCAQKPE